VQNGVASIRSKDNVMRHSRKGPSTGKRNRPKHLLPESSAISGKKALPQQQPEGKEQGFHPYRRTNKRSISQQRSSTEHKKNLFLGRERTFGGRVSKHKRKDQYREERP